MFFVIFRGDTLSHLWKAALEVLDSSTSNKNNKNNNNNNNNTNTNNNNNDNDNNNNNNKDLFASAIFTIHLRKW